MSTPRTFKAIKNIQVGDRIYIQKSDSVTNQKTHSSDNYFLMSVTDIERVKASHRVRTLFGWSKWRFSEWRYEIANDDSKAYVDAPVLHGGHAATRMRGVTID